MDKIVHARVDYRLIHGQVVTKWMKVCGATKIVIIDDVLAKDEFLGMIYKMAAPQNVGVEIVTIADAKNEWEKGSFYGDKILLLYKTIDTLLETTRKGIILEKIQIGGVENKAGRKVVHNQITLDMADYEKLCEIESKGTNVYFQTVAGEEVSDLNKVLKKLK